MIPVITLRPELGGEATVQHGAAAGLDIRAFPMSEIAPIAWEPPAPETIDGLLLGSANAVRQAGPGLGLFRGKPAFVVGDATAKAARAAGLAVQQIGQGGLQDVLALLPGSKLRLLRLTARRHLGLALPPNVTVETRVAYYAGDLPMPPALAELLRAPAVVLLHSAGSAEHFAAECDRLGIDRTAIRLAALGPRIAAAAGSGWADLRSASEPRETALVALAAQMCQ